MEVWGEIIKCQQEPDAQQKSNCRRHNAPFAAVCFHLHCGYEQRPYRRRHHHTWGKAQQRLLYSCRHFVLHQKDKCRAKHRAQQRNQQSYNQCRCHREQKYNFLSNCEILKSDEMQKGGQSPPFNHFAGSHLHRTGDTIVPSFFNSAKALSTSLRSIPVISAILPALTGAPNSRMACNTFSFMTQ